MVALRQVFLGLLIAVSCGCNGSDRRGLAPGDTAPNITGQNLSGAPQSLYDIKATGIVLNFWATWCGPCVSELPALESLYEKLKDEGLTVVGVAVDDTPENIKEYQERFKLTYPIIIDSSSESKRAYKLGGLPETFILNKDHAIVLMEDVDGGEPLTRIIGPREWTSPTALKILRTILH